MRRDHLKKTEKKYYKNLENLCSNFLVRPGFRTIIRVENLPGISHVVINF
jgi:hypothetical protein